MPPHDLERGVVDREGRAAEQGGIRVVRKGEQRAGPPVLLIHGFTGSVEAWGEAIVEGLARRGPLLAVDLPGHGESEAPSDAGRYAMDRIVSDLVEVLDRAGAGAADWVGYSMGGRIALAAAVLQPGRVRRLVLEGASPGLADGSERIRRRRQDERIAHRIEADGIEAFVDFWMSRPLFASQERLPAALLWNARRLRLRNRPAALAAVLRGLGTGSQPSFWERLAEVEAPTLLVTGELDRKFEPVARDMAERFPRAKHRIVPDAGHAVHLESPRGWLESVVPFLDGEEPR